MTQKKRQRVVIIGPSPPPDTGVTMPFSLFCDWFTTTRGDEYQVRIVSTNSGDKSLVSLYNPKVMVKLFQIGCAIVWGALWADRVVVFGSNRFISSVGGAMALCMWPLRKPVSLRIFGGAYECYLQSRWKSTQWLIRRLFGLAHRIVVQPRLVADALRPIWPAQIRCVRNYRIPVSQQTARV